MVTVQAIHFLNERSKWVLLPFIYKKRNQKNQEELDRRLNEELSHIITDWQRKIKAIL